MPSQRGSTQSRFGNLQIVRAQGQVVVPHPTPLLCMAMAPPPPPPHQWWLRRHSRVRGFNKPRWGPDGLFGSIRTGARSRARGQWVTPHSCTVQWAPPELKGSVGAPTLGSRPDALAHGNKRGWGAFPLTPSNQRKIRSGRRGRSIRDIPLDRRDKWECSKPLQPIKGGLMSTWIGAGQLHKVRRGRVRAL